MTDYLLSPEAQADIEEIWTHTAKRWDVDQAERYVRQLEAGIGIIAANPSLGVACD